MAPRPGTTTGIEARLNGLYSDALDALVLGYVERRAGTANDRVFRVARFSTSPGAGYGTQIGWREVAAVGRSGIQLLGWGEYGYPELLARIYDPPPVLWVRGTLPPERRASVGIVGSRQATPAGRALARSMARDLAGAGA